jgi:hypothetical protein
MKCRSKKKSFFCFTAAFALCFSPSLYAKFNLGQTVQQSAKESFVPWFTGPLLAPSTTTVPQGHVNIEPYYYYQIFNGFYTDAWKATPSKNFYAQYVQLFIQAGVSENADLQILPQYFWNSYNDQKCSGFGDTLLISGLKIYTEDTNTWYPSVKLALLLNAPTGRYQKLNPKKLGTDLTGLGVWAPGATLVFGRQINLDSRHVISVRASANYNIGTAVHVKGINAYGGDITTKGIVYPGNSLFVDVAFEANITQSWVYAMDITYTHANKTRFTGKSLFPNTKPSSEQFALAPALEYNFNANIGLISGVWFSYAGRNTLRFLSGVLALNVYI